MVGSVLLCTGLYRFFYKISIETVNAIEDVSNSYLTLVFPVMSHAAFAVS
jgi:hypothetical protein